MDINELGKATFGVILEIHVDCALLLFRVVHAGCLFL